MSFSYAFPRRNRKPNLKKKSIHRWILFTAKLLRMAPIFEAWGQCSKWPVLTKHWTDGGLIGKAEQASEASNGSKHLQQGAPWGNGSTCASWSRGLLLLLLVFVVCCCIVFMIISQWDHKRMPTSTSNQVTLIQQLKNISRVILHVIKHIQVYYSNICRDSLSHCFQYRT